MAPQRVENGEKIERRKISRPQPFFPLIYEIVFIALIVKYVQLIFFCHHRSSSRKKLVDFALRCSTVAVQLKNLIQSETSSLVEETLNLARQKRKASSSTD